MQEDFYTDEIELLEQYHSKLAKQVKSEARGKAKAPKPRDVSKVAEPRGLEGGFKITYKPTLYEEGWLLESIRTFYDQELITDVLAQVKGGKEASVYRCRANSRLDVEMVAAKVYRPRKFRNLSNDKMYRQGRAVLTGDGKAVKKTDHRLMRAIGKKTAFGQEVAHTSWLMYEYTTLENLYKLGAAVPKPLAASDNAILMSYHGSAHVAAPTLNEISLNKKEAETLFEEVLRNIELMLKQDLIHGDLSAYNILYWEGEIILIDFPQVSSSQSNPNAKFILQRDITRVCEYFSKQGVKCNADQLMTELWGRYATWQTVTQFWEQYGDRDTWEQINNQEEA